MKVENGPVIDATVTDKLPDGQTYKAGSGQVGGSPSEPDVTDSGKTLTWHLGTLNDAAFIPGTISAPTAHPEAAELPGHTV